MANARAIGQMLVALRAEANTSSKAEKDTTQNIENSKKSLPVKQNHSCVTRPKTKEKASAKSNHAEKVKEKQVPADENLASGSVREPTHPKAVGNLLKMLQSEKERYYEEPQKERNELKIFTQYHEPQNELREYEDEYADSILEKKKKADENDFYCELCKVTCTSQVVLDTHLIGKRHMKNVKKLEDATMAFKTVAAVPPSKHMFSALIQTEFENLAETDSVVGLEYVTEYQSFGESGHRYFCELCELRTNMTDMLCHVIGRNHRLRYMRSHFFDIYYKITGYPSFKNMMTPSDADKLLEQHSSFVIRTVLKGNLPHCKVKPFRGEASMQIDLRKHPGPGGIHPSQHKDLPKVEALLANAEIAEQNEKEEIERKQKEEAERQKELEEQQKMEQQRLEKEREIELIVERRRDRLMHEAARMGHQLVNPSQLPPQEYALKRLEQQKLQESRLNEQELRIMTALSKLQGSCQDREMNPDEHSAKKKLIRLLAGIRAQRQINSKHFVEKTPTQLDINKQSSKITRENEKVISYDGKPLVENRFKLPVNRHSGYPEEINTNYKEDYSQFGHRSHADEMRAKASPNVVEVRSDKNSQTNSYQAVAHASSQPEKIEVASVIEKARKQVEEKILRALTSGSLAPLAKAFKNNPKLQAGLKHWEKKHSETYSESATSQKVDHQRVKNFRDSSVTQHDMEYSSNPDYNRDASRQIQMPDHHISHSLVQMNEHVDREKQWKYDRECMHENSDEDCERRTSPVFSGYRDQQKTLAHSNNLVTTGRAGYKYLDKHDTHSNVRSYPRSEDFDELSSPQVSRSGYSETSSHISGGQVRTRKRGDAFVPKSKHLYSGNDNKFAYPDDSDTSETSFEDEHSDYGYHKYYRRDHGEDSSRRTENNSYKEKSKTLIVSRPQFNHSPPRRKYARENCSTSRSRYY